MANLTLTPSFDAGIYQLETTDPVQGGASGASNKQAIALGNRTEYLKAHMDAAESNISTNTSELADHETRVSNIEAAKFSTLGDNFVRGIKTVAAGTISISNSDYGKLIIIDCQSSNPAIALPSLSGLTVGTKFNFIIWNSNSTYLFAKVLFSSTDGSIQFAGNLNDFQPGDSIVFSVKDSVTWVVTFVTKKSDSGPAGMVGYFAASTPPAGWLAADGSAISRTSYSRLFAQIGVTYGVGNGTTTFNLPDMRGYFVRGWDNGRGVDIGRTFGTNQADDYKSHSHNFQVWNVSGVTSAGAAVGKDSTAGTFATEASGGTETRPVNIAFLGCIKY